MKVTVEVLCDMNKAVITTPFDKFNMEYDDMLGLELFTALLLNNSFIMSVEAKTKLQNPFKDLYGREASIFIADTEHKSYCHIDVSLSDSDIDLSMSQIQEKLSTKNGRLCLR